MSGAYAPPDWADYAAAAMADDAAKQWASELRSMLDDNVRTETRRQLIAECAVEGSEAHAALQLWIAEDGPVSASTFIAICEECTTRLWESAYARIMDEEIEAWEANQ